MFMLSIGDALNHYQLDWCPIAIAQEPAKSKAKAKPKAAPLTPQQPDAVTPPES